MTAWYQARQLAPILGEAGPPLRGKILHKLRADLPFLFGAAQPRPGLARLVVGDADAGAPADAATQPDAAAA